MIDPVINLWCSITKEKLKKTNLNNILTPNNGTGKHQRPPSSFCDHEQLHPPHICTQQIRPLFLEMQLLPQDHQVQKLRAITTNMSSISLIAGSVPMCLTMYGKMHVSFLLEQVMEGILWLLLLTKTGKSLPMLRLSGLSRRNSPRDGDEQHVLQDERHVQWDERHVQWDERVEKRTHGRKMREIS